MAEFTHSILAADAAISADGDQVFDLPVGPLSVVLLKIAPLNETATLTNYSFLEGLLSAVDNIRVTHRGGDVFSMSGVDAAALALLWHGFGVWQSNARETDNERRALVIPIVLGKKAYDRSMCFPATKKGELLMTVRFDIADTGFDGLRASVETIELPGATPDLVQKCTTLARTFTATGQNEIDLPIGNLLAGVLLFGTTGFTGAAPAPTVGQVQLLVNNNQRYFSASDWEVLRAIIGLQKVGFPADGVSTHGFNDAAAGQVFTRQPHAAAALDDNYALLNLDPTSDREFVLNTEGASRVHVRIEAETADACRVLPIEYVPTSRYLEAP